MRLSTLLLLAVVLAVAALATLSEASRTYGVTSLSITDCAVHDNLQPEIGDDRSGMAITPTRLFHLGDNFMVSFNATTLADDVLLPITDGIISDLGDGALWTLAFDNSTFLNANDAEGGTYNITHVIADRGQRHRRCIAFGDRSLPAAQPLQRRKSTGAVRRSARIRVRVGHR
jgi:hypothetical protein